MKIKKLIKSVVTGLTACTIAISSSVCCFADEDNGNSISLGSVTKLFKLFDKPFSDDENYAYKENLNIKFGEGMNEIVGEKLKPVDILGTKNVKDGKMSYDLGIKYNSKSLCTVQTIFDDKTGINYLRIPELSDAYLSGTDEETALNFSDLIYGDDSGLSSVLGSIENLLDMTDGIDLNFENDLQILYAVLAIIFDSFPAGTAGSNISGDIDNYTYDYTSTVYTIDRKDLLSIIKSSAKQAKNDDDLKVLAKDMGFDEANLNALIDDIEYFFSQIVEESESPISLKLYDDEGDFGGFGITAGEKEILNFILIDNDEAFAIDFNLNADYLQYSFIGSMTTDTGKMTGAFTLITLTNYDEDEDVSSETVKITLKDFELIDSSIISGNVKIETTEKYSNMTTPDVTVFDLNSDSTSEKVNMTLNVIKNSKEFLTLTFTSEEIEPVDIELPTESVYSITKQDEREKYLKSCDIDGFLMNAKNVLGDKLYAFIESYFYDDPSNDPSESSLSEQDSNSSNDSSVISKESSSDVKTNLSTNSDKKNTAFPTNLLTREQQSA